MLLLLLLLGTVVVLMYLVGVSNERYWKKRGVTFMKDNRVAGPLWNFVTGEKSFFEIMHKIYKDYPNDPAVAFGSFLTPAVFVRDSTNVQFVLQNDFQSFSHRGMEIDKKDKLAQNVLLLNGTEWKLIRQQMSPLFTAAKLKNMYYIIDKSAQDFVEFLQENPKRRKDDVFDTLNMFCSAAIGAAVFGVSTGTVFDTPFLDVARNAFKTTLLRNIKFAIVNVSLWLSNFLGVTLFRDDEDFFIAAVKQIIRERKKDNVKRHDFADLCVALQNAGPMKDQDTGLVLEPTDELLAAQAFFFFIAGVEPCATAMFAAFIELSRHPEILQKVHDEIDETFQKTNGQFTYDVVMKMEYLDKVLSEALRVFPPIGFLTRMCVRDAVLPVGHIKIAQGTKVYTPVYSFHHDHQYYPNPEVFDPERFAGDAKNADITYQPFGKGNRICIGMRYARLQVKAGLLHLLRNFTLKPIEGDTKFYKVPAQVRPIRSDVELIPRKLKSN